MTTTTTTTTTAAKILRLLRPRPTTTIGCSRQGTPMDQAERPSIETKRATKTHTRETSNRRERERKKKSSRVVFCNRNRHSHSHRHRVPEMIREARSSPCKTVAGDAVAAAAATLPGQRKEGCATRCGTAHRKERCSIEVYSSNRHCLRNPAIFFGTANAHSLDAQGFVTTVVLAAHSFSLRVRRHP